MILKERPEGRSFCLTWYLRNGIVLPMNKKVCQKPTPRNPNGREGTATGYAAHLNAKEAPCEECRAGKAEADRKYREANQERILRNRRRYYDENAEEIRRKSREWHHENKERANEYSRNYRIANPERVKEKINAWHRENRGHLDEYMREWRASNAHLLKVYGNRRRAREKELPSDNYTVEDLLLAHGDECYLCGAEVDIFADPKKPWSPHVDHRVPLIDPECPGDVISNCFLTHARCNFRKGKKSVDELDLPFDPPVAE